MEPYIAYEKENGNNSVVVLDHNWETFKFARLGGTDIGKIEYLEAGVFMEKYRYKNLM